MEHYASIPKYADWTIPVEKRKQEFINDMKTRGCKRAELEELFEQAYGNRTLYLWKLYAEGVVEADIEPGEGTMDGLLLESFMDIPEDSLIYFDVDNDDYNKILVKYCLPDDQHFIVDTEWWFESPQGIHEKVIYVDNV